MLTSIGEPGSISRTAAAPKAAALDANFARVLWDTSALHPDRHAVLQRDRVVSYGELRERAAAVAGALARSGIRPQDRVGLFLERGADAAAAFFGVLAAGAVAVNINERLRPRQIEYILQHAGARLLLTSTELLALQPRPVKTTAAVLFLEQLTEATACSPCTRGHADIAQIIYTSGSTGLPKGVMLTHGNLRAGTAAVTKYLDIDSDDRLASILPFSFDYGLNQLFCAVAASAALVVETSPLPIEVIAALRRQEVTVLAAVPPLWLQLLAVQDFVERPLPSLRAMTNTGGRLPIEAIRKLRRAQPQAELFLMYGLTEAFRATYLPPGEADRRPDSIGKAIPGAKILVLNGDGAVCGPGEIGELVQAGPTVAAGYWNDPEATARVFRPHPLRSARSLDGNTEKERVVYSGDLVRTDEQGFLFYVGRRDRMIKTLGVRVSPDEIVNVLYASGQILEAAVVAEPSRTRGESIIAHVVLSANGSLEKLQAFCRLELPHHMQPARIEVRDTLPRTSSGKHDVDRLLDPFAVGR